MTSAIALDQPVPIVSCDTHIGPRLVDDLRPYCPRELLGAFDDFAAETAEARARLHAMVGGRTTAAFTRNHATAGHYAVDQRLADLDREGVAAEVIFHGSQNEEPVPFGTFVAFLGPASDDPDLVAAGRSIYNRWLADFVSTAPERHAGLAQLPIWDVRAAVDEVVWARDAGLRGVNFPAPSPDLNPYNDRSWEPLWAACADLSMPLTTHSGAGDPRAWTGREATALVSLESGGWFSRRALHQMIFGGVFERHPDLRLVLTEQPGDWWSYTLRELDSAYLCHRDSLGDQVPRLPSDYCRENVVIGGSFLAPFEALDAVDADYVGNVMWGSDYPHMEGTFQHPRDEHDRPMTPLSLRHTFSAIAAPATRSMVSDTAIEVYGLDRETLEAVARRIDAPTLADLSEPLDEVPADGGILSFRTFGPWA